MRIGVLAAAASVLAACNTPRDAAQSDSAAGGSPTAKLDSTSNPNTIDGDTTGMAPATGTTPGAGKDTSTATTPPTP